MSETVNNLGSLTGGSPIESLSATIKSAKLRLDRYRTDKAAVNEAELVARQRHAKDAVRSMDETTFTRLSNEVQFALRWNELGLARCLSVYMSDDASRNKLHDQERWPTIDRALSGTTGFERANSAMGWNFLAQERGERLKFKLRIPEGKSAWLNLNDDQVEGVEAAARTIINSKYRARSFSSSITKKDVAQARDRIQSCGIQGVFLGVKDDQDVLSRFEQTFMGVEQHNPLKRFRPKIG